MDKIKLYCVYILECSDGTYYTGITNNFNKRLNTHNTGKGSKYISTRLPAKLLYKTENVLIKSDALKLEYAVKQQNKRAKLTFLKNEEIKYVS